MLMAHTHCSGPGQVTGPGTMGFYTILCNVLHSDTDREPLFSIVPIPFPGPCPGPGPMQCVWVIVPGTVKRYVVCIAWTTRRRRWFLCTCRFRLKRPNFFYDSKLLKQWPIFIAFNFAKIIKRCYKNLNAVSFSNSLVIQHNVPQYI